MKVFEILSCQTVNEGKGDVDTSMVLYYLTDAYKSISHSDAYGPGGKETIKMIYDTFRDALKKDDFDAFKEDYDRLSGKYPDEFDELMNAAFEAAGLGQHGTYEKFIAKASS